MMHKLLYSLGIWTAALLLAASGPVTFYANYPDGGPRQWADRAGEVNATFKLAKSATSGIAVTV